MSHDGRAMIGIGTGRGRAHSWRIVAGACAAVLVATGCTLEADVSATGAVEANVSHLWITVSEVWFATAADTTPEATAGWTKSVLATPVTVDLATLSQSTLASLASAISLPAGTYKQVHLVVADSSDALLTSAQSLGFTTNAGITLADASGTVTTSALESPIPEGGITIPVDLVLAGSFDFGSSSNTDSTTATGTTSTSTTSTTSTTKTSTLAVTIDAARDVLPYTYGTTTSYLLSAVALVTDEKYAGAISGTVDTSGLAAGYGEVTVSAETTDATNSHHVVVQRRLVGIDGAFTLYPLPAPSSGTTNYDLVISSSGAETVIIRDVPVSSAAVTSAVAVQSTPIVLGAANPVYANVGTELPLLPGGARVDFYQTVAASGELPYVVAGTAVDILSHRLPNGAFAVSNGPIVVGTYASGGSISFSTLAPVEGEGGYVIGTEGLYRADALATAPSVITGTSTAPTPILAPYPPVAAGGVAGSIAVTLTAPIGEFDSGFVIVAAGNRIVDATNVGAVLAAGGGTVNFTNLPAGSGLAATAGVPYQVALRAWNSNSAASSFIRATSTASAVLGNAGRATVALQLP